MLVMQAFGRALVLEPYLATVVLGGTAIRARRQPTTQQAALLPAIAEGALKLAFAHGERQARYDLTDVADHRQARTAAAGCWTARRAWCRMARRPTS